MRWSAISAFSAFVHLSHSALIFVLTMLVQPPAGPMLQFAWGVGAFFTVMTLLVFLRVGNYDETTEEEVGTLIRGGYWMATGVYLSLLAVSLFFILRA